MILIKEANNLFQTDISSVLNILRASCNGVKCCKNNSADSGWSSVPESDQTS